MTTLEFYYTNFHCEVLQEGKEEKEKEDYQQQNYINQRNHIIFVSW